MTKEQFIEKYTGGHWGDTQNVKARLEALATYVHDFGMQFRGSAAASVIAAADPVNGDVYKVTTGGNLNTGDAIVAAATGDLVIYNSTTELWSLLYDVS
jgi:hypothetical protein